MNENECGARHSHNLSMWKNFIVLSGGIDKYENPLNDVILIDSLTFEVRKLSINKGYVLPRYSSHLI